MGNRYLPTGNEFISIPDINRQDAAIGSFTLLHMGYKGMLAFHGTDDTPLFKPVIAVDEAPVLLDEISWRRTESWIPCFDVKTDGLDVSGTVLCPIDHRGFAIRLMAHNTAHASRKISLGISGLWAGVLHSVNEDKAIHGEMLTYTSIWSDAPVFDLRIGAPVMAFAPMSSLPMMWNTHTGGTGICYDGVHIGTIEADAVLTLDIFWGVGFEEVAAVTAAKEQVRHGFDALFSYTVSWLVARRKTVADSEMDEILNLNLFFNYFYAAGITMDTEETVMVTSRSPRYYVSAAYWDRDGLLWSFPSILRIDKDRARELLDYVFTRQIRNVGVHSRYIDGTVLEPGFELDELCAPVLALARYVDATGDAEILRDTHIEKGVRSILRILADKQNALLGLYETFLQPTDDMRTYPYLTYDNVLVWRMLIDISRLYKILWNTETLKFLDAEASKLRTAILTYCVRVHEGREIFAWSVDADGNWDVYDEPPGSLQLLPSLDFCDFDDPVWVNTVEVIRRKDYPYSFAGKPFAEIGCAHAPHPWILSVCNSLLCGRVEEASDFLRRAEMDDGIACESVDEYIGSCATGAAFATCAGFLAHCMMTALNGGEAQ